MRAPQWETSSGALAALLNARTPVTMVDLYTVTLADGTVFRWSGGDAAVTIQADPDSANVVLLLQGENADGSNTITDGSAAAHTTTLVSLVTNTTSNKKYGSGALKNIGSGGNVEFSGSSDFALPMVFTIEAWLYATSWGGDTSYLWSTNVGRYFFISSTGTMSPIGWGLSASVQLTLNQWNHVAWARDAAGNNNGFVNGVRTVGSTNSVTSATATPFGLFGVPARSDLRSFIGLIDDFRWTQGVCRYVNPFTPPAGPFSTGGMSWSLGPGIRRNGIRSVVGVEANTLNLTIHDVLGTTINGTALIPFIRAGGLAGATVQLDRAFIDGSNSSPTGTLRMFSGRVADIECDRYEARVTVKSSLELLDVKLPRDVYQTGCLNTLFDTACGLSRATYAVTGTASGATDSRKLTFTHGLSQGSGYFDLGVVKFTSGPNTGISRTVKAHTLGSPGQLTVLQPWPFAVTAGDAFTAWPGCDKSRVTCNNKFSNLARFRGMPFIPVPETVT